MIHWQGIDVDTILLETRQQSGLWGKYHQLDYRDKIALQARSGKGKSTAIGILAGTRTDYTGRLLIDGGDRRNISVPQQSQLLQRTFGIVWQDLRLIPDLSGKDNVLLKHLLLPRMASGIDEVESWADLLGVSAVWHKPAHQLSYGERQRIAIIRALSAPFKMILLDEPFSHLDQHNSNLAARLIRSVCAERGAGYIFTTLDEAPYLEADRTILI
jgi:ABC-type lipoprotein export system ATPase subunit